jgi:hypothetical protein
MNFLNGALLPGLAALVALPLVIHLLNKQFPRLFEFSTIKHLRETIAQRSRLFRWRHLILLTLRTLFLIALLLAFLKPILPRFGSNAAKKVNRTVLIMIDHSLSMEHQSGGLNSRQRASSEADKVLSTLEPDDLVNVLLVGSAPTSCFFEFSKQVGEARRFVQDIKPGYTSANFTQANALAGRLLAQDAHGVEIYYLSDFQRKNWSNVDFTPLPPAARFFFVDVGAESRGNYAILNAAFNQSQVLADDTVTLEVEIGNYRPEPLREPLRIVLDSRASFEKEVNVAPWSTTKVTVPVPAGGPGLHLCDLSLPPDSLNADNHAFLTLPVVEKEGVLIVADAPDPDKDAVLYLRTAFNPYENLAGSLLPEQSSAGGLTPDKIASVRKIFFTRTGRMDESAAKLVSNFIFHGGGAVYFIDGEYDAENLAAIERAAGAPLPLKVGKKRVAQNVTTGAQQILKGDFKSKFLRLFRGTQRQNLSLMEFYDVHDATATGAGPVLLTYADDTPAMAQMNHGLGTLLLMNFSVSEFSSNLARQRIFPAWMQELVKNLASDEPIPSSSIVGETVVGEVWKSDLKDNTLMGPSGERQIVKTEPLGERVAISFNPSELGFYSLRRGTRLLNAFAVNASSDESDLRPIDRSLLPDQLSEKGQQGYFVEGREDFADLVHGRPIFHWLVLAGIVLLLIELAFQAFIKRAASQGSRRPVTG